MILDISSQAPHREVACPVDGQGQNQLVNVRPRMRLRVKKMDTYLSVKLQRADLALVSTIEKQYDDNCKTTTMQLSWLSGWYYQYIVLEMIS